MRIAILGATGMIGHHVVREAIHCGHEVIAVSRSGARLNDPELASAIYRRADLADPVSLRTAFAEAEAIIHCAGYYPSLPRPLSQEIALARQLSENFYSACAGLPLRKVVYVGAAIAIPRQKDGAPSNGQESYGGPPPDKNPYVQVKWLQDVLALKHAKAGLPVVIGVPAMTFGEFDPGNSTGRFILEVANRTMPGYVDGKRNVVYAGDAARGLLRAAEDGVPGRRYLFTGSNLSVRDLIAKIAAISGAPQPSAIPLRLASMLSTWQGLRYRYLRGPKPRIHASAIAVMAYGQFLDGEIAKRDLGYVPAVSVEEAIRRTFAWLQAQGMIHAPVVDAR